MDFLDNFLAIANELMILFSSLESRVFQFQTIQLIIVWSAAVQLRRNDKNRFVSRFSGNERKQRLKRFIRIKRLEPLRQLKENLHINVDLAKLIIRSFSKQLKFNSNAWKVHLLPMKLKITFGKTTSWWFSLWIFNSVKTKPQMNVGGKKWMSEIKNPHKLN